MKLQNFIMLVHVNVIKKFTSEEKSLIEPIIERDFLHDQRTIRNMPDC